MKFGRLSFLFLVSFACNKNDTYPGNFERPMAVAIVQPEVGGPFEEPIGYVASGDDGRIWALALKRGQFLADDSEASFLRGSPIATGSARRLISLATWAPTDDRIELFAGDSAFQQLVHSRHVIGVQDGTPVEPEAKVESTEFIDNDASGDAPEITVLAHTGDATSETWTLTYGNDIWSVVGSRSGDQQDTVLPGQWYQTDNAALSIQIAGTATDGDQFQIVVDAQITEIDLAGTPIALAMLPDQSRLAAIVEDRTTGNTRLAWVDPATDTEIAGPELEEAVIPWRFSVMEDGTIYVADRGAPAAWEIGPEGLTDKIELPWPIADIAALDTPDGRWLYVIPAGSTEVWVFNRLTGEAIDGNSWLSGIQGLNTRAPISGLEAIPIAYQWPETDGDGVHTWGTSVAASLASGRTVFIEEGRPCLVQDPTGPRTRVETNNRNGDLTLTFDNTTGGPRVLPNGTDGHHARVNPCAGVARPETWTVRFDRNRQAWQVEGSVSGIQSHFAYEDSRYLSDDGAISFYIASGNQPTRDGDTFRFSVVEGAVSADGDNNHDGRSDINFDVPGEPVFFWYRVGRQDGGWDPVDLRPFVLVPGAASDLVARIKPQTGDLEINWR